MPGHDIVVVGASTGGLGALKILAAALPEGLPAAVFVVWHQSARAEGLLAQVLDRAGPLPAAWAGDGEAVAPGRIYVAPPDRHLILEPGAARLSRGPKENRFRPALDPLFRSAALAYGPRVVGVVLTGALDDGTAGLWAVKDRGGLAVVQDPDEADEPSMPRSALAHVAVDYRLPLADLGPTLARLARAPAGPAPAAAPPEWLSLEARFARGEGLSNEEVGKLGELAFYACPECHGSLVELRQAGVLRFRCHVGHSYTAATLAAELALGVEDALWSAMRAADEAATLLEHLSRHSRAGRDPRTAASLALKAKEARQRADLARRAVLLPESEPGP